MPKNLCLSVLILSVVTSKFILAQTPDTVFLEELTWTEVASAIDNGSTTIIIPTAGTEQNGPHMVLGKHKYRINAGSERIARSLGNTLVAPVITYVPEGDIDPPSGHMRFAGTWSREGINVFHIGDWYKIGVFDDYLISQGANYEQIGSHAGLRDTSLLLAIAPEHVRTNSMSPGRGPDVDGVSGDPTIATAEYGQIGFDLIFNAALNQIKELMQKE